MRQAAPKRQTRKSKTMCLLFKAYYKNPWFLHRQTILHGSLLCCCITLPISRMHKQKSCERSNLMILKPTQKLIWTTCCNFKPGTKPKTMNSASICLLTKYCAAQGTSLGNSSRASKRIRTTTSNSTRNRLIASPCRYGLWSKLGECSWKANKGHARRYTPCASCLMI